MNSIVRIFSTNNFNLTAKESNSPSRKEPYMIFIDSISNPIPSSFVKNSVKLCNDTGHGEAKFYFPKDRALNDYLNFFNHFSETNIYQFHRTNLLQYLNDPTIIHAYNSRSYGINGPTITETYRQHQLTLINILPNVIPFTLQNRSFLDSQNRYYIRSYDNIFHETLRDIAIPRLTNLQINKYLYDDCPPHLITYINDEPIYPNVYNFVLMV